MSRRAMIVTGLAVLFSLSLVASPALAQQRTKVTVWLIGEEVTGSYGQVWAKIKEHIERDLPHIEVDVQFGASPDQRFIVAYAAGNAPDVVTLQTASSAQFIKAGMVVPIDYEAFGVKDIDELKAFFYPGALGSMYAYDDIYFMPTELTTFGMYYNIDMMREVGIDVQSVPRTWEELIDIGKKFMRRSADGSTFDRVGLALNTGWIWPSFRWAALLRQAGIDWLVDGKPMFNSPEALEAISLYARMFHEDQITVPTTGSSQFTSGRAAFYLGPSYQLRPTQLPAQIQFEFGTASYPSIDPNRRVSTSYAWGLYVSSSSQVQREAWEVINYLTSERWAPTWYATSALLIPRAGDWILDIIAEQPLLAPFITELEYARMEIVHPEYAAIRSAITEADNAIINRTTSVANVLAQLNHNIEVLVNP